MKKKKIARILDIYYQRTLRIKEQVMNSPQTLENITAAFENTYLHKELPDTITIMDRGNTHIIYNVGEVIDPLNSQTIHLAIRLADSQFTEYYDLGLRKYQFIPQITQFQRAFFEKENPPYFVAATSWNGPKDLFENRLLGFLLEDVTEKGKYTLSQIDPYNESRFWKYKGEKRITSCFLDPIFPQYMDTDQESKYLSDEAIIPIN